MSLKRIIASTVMSLVIVAGLSAAKSDVADAVMKGDTAAVRALIGKSADVNAPQADGSTALHWAVYRSDITTADLLMRAGANAPRDLEELWRRIVFFIMVSNVDDHLRNHGRDQLYDYIRLRSRHVSINSIAYSAPPG